jgi:hypothetical protein
VQNERPAARHRRAERGRASSTREVVRMDIEEIKTLTDLMVENNLSEIVIRDGEKRILLRRGAKARTGAALRCTWCRPRRRALPAPPGGPGPAPRRRAGRRG